MSEEKVLTLRGKRAVWAPVGGSGPIDPKRLPEGYPYKEQSETVIFEKQTEQFSEVEGHMQANLSNCALVTGQTIKVVWDDKEYECEVDGSLGMPAAGNFTALGVPSAASVDCPFLFVSGPDYITATAVTEMDTEHTIRISEHSETIHTMAPEFLPAGVGGGGLVFEITESDYTNDTSNYTVTKNYDPIYEQLEKGGSVVIKLHDTTGIVFIVPQMSMALAGQGFVIITRGAQSNMTLVFTTGSYH